MTEKRAFTQGGRITSIHGILLPPKRRQAICRHITIRLAITGTIPSKKNQLYASTNLPLLRGSLYRFTVVREAIDWLERHMTAFLKNSKRWEEWVEKTKPVLLRQAKSEEKKYAKWGVNLPLDNVSIRVYHYWKDNRVRDNSNKFESIADLLVDAGILKDDSWQVIGKNESESECYEGEILDHITTIDITQRFFDERPSSGASASSESSVQPQPEATRIGP